MFYLTDDDLGSFNGCSKATYEKIAAVLLHILPMHFSIEGEDLPANKREELVYFYEKHKRRFFDRRCLKRPVYTLKVNEEGGVVHDKEGVPVILINTYCKGEIKSRKHLLYREAIEDVLRDLHHVQSASGEHTCLPGGVNAVSRKFNEKFSFKGNFACIKTFLAKCSSCQVNNPLPMTFCKPPVPIRSFHPHSRLQCDLIDMAPKKHRNFMENNRWGYRYVLTVKCCFSKFCWLFPLKSKSADEVYAVLKALFIKEGAPSIIQSDNGGEFIAEVIQKLCNEFQVKIVHGRPHHPQSQGQVENLNKQVKRLLARFLQLLSRDLQANVWPLLLSPIADMLNSKWHSTINDIPFRIYKNRSPNCQVFYVIPDDNMWLESVEDGCLEDFQFSTEDFADLATEEESTPIDTARVKELSEAILKISSDTILSSSLGSSASILAPMISKIMEDKYSSSSFGSNPGFMEHPSTQVQTEDTDVDFHSERIDKYLVNLSESSKLVVLDVLEATEHTIQKNHKRSLKKAKERDFKEGDMVLFRHPSTEGCYFSKVDPYKPLNDIGIIKEVLSGGMYRVQVECDDDVVMKSIFGGQMVLFRNAGQHDVPPHAAPKLSLLTVHNSISEFGLTVRKEIYKGLRLSKSVRCGSVDALFKSFCEALDFGLLAMLCSLSGKEEEEAHFHQMFVNRLSTLQKAGFRYFLYGTIYWERERKQNLGSCILAHLANHPKHSDCLSCVTERKQEACFHACCQHIVFQMALNSGLLSRSDDGRIETTFQSSALEGAHSHKRISSSPPGNQVDVPSKGGSGSGNQADSGSSAPRFAAVPGKGGSATGNQADSGSSAPRFAAVPGKGGSATGSQADSGSSAPRFAAVPGKGGSATGSQADSGSSAPRFAAVPGKGGSATGSQADSGSSAPRFAAVLGKGGSATGSQADSGFSAPRFAAVPGKGGSATGSQADSGFSAPRLAAVPGKGGSATGSQADSGSSGPRFAAVPGKGGSATGSQADSGFSAPRFAAVLGKGGNATGSQTDSGSSVPRFAAVPGKGGSATGSQADNGFSVPRFAAVPGKGGSGSGNQANSGSSGPRFAAVPGKGGSGSGNQADSGSSVPRFAAVPGKGGSGSGNQANSGSSVPRFAGVPGKGGSVKGNQANSGSSGSRFAAVPGKGGSGSGNQADSGSSVPRFAGVPGKGGSVKGNQANSGSSGPRFAAVPVKGGSGSGNQANSGSSGPRFAGVPGKGGSASGNKADSGSSESRLAPVPDKDQLSSEDLKVKCLQQVENIDPWCPELAEFEIPLKILIAESKPSNNATERMNLGYFFSIIGKHAEKLFQSQVRLHQKSGDKTLMQTQGFSSFCGLCAMNNAIGITEHQPPVFDLLDLDLAADVVWIRQICEVGCGFSVPSEPMRCLDGDYSILAMEEAALKKNCTFQRMDMPLRALLDGAALHALNTNEVKEFYSLILGLFGEDEKPALILRIKRYHFVTLLLKQDQIVLLDSQRNSPLALPIKAGLGYIQKEAYQNPEFAAVNIQKQGLCKNPVLVDELPVVDLDTNFHCTLDEVWDSTSTIADDTIISTLHGHVTARDMRTLKPGEHINDVVINYIGAFLMSQKPNVYVASTFWLSRCSAGRETELEKCDLHKFEKFIFPIHCPGHWWCVMIDKPNNFYGEFDSLCQHRNSDFVFALLNSAFQTKSIDLSSFQRLSQQERQQLPSQGQNRTECGAFLLGFMSAFVHNLTMNFGLREMSFLRPAFAKIILNGRPSSSVENGVFNTGVCTQPKESDSAEETIQSIEQADIDGKHSGLTDCDRTSEEPTCSQSVFDTEVCTQTKESDSAEETIQSIEQADIDGKHSEGLTDCDRTSEEPTCIQYSDDIDDDPFNLPPPLSPLDVQLLEDSVQRDELGRLFVIDVINVLP